MKKLLLFLLLCIPLYAQTNITFNFNSDTNPVADGSTASATVTQATGGETIRVVSTGGQFVVGEEIGTMGTDFTYFDGYVTAFDLLGSPNSTRIRVSLQSGKIFNLNTLSILDNDINTHPGRSITLISSDGTIYDAGSQITYSSDYGEALIDVSLNSGFRGITYFDLYADGLDMQLVLDNIYLTNIVSPPAAAVPDGNGSSGTPYEISSLENLTWLANQVNSGNAFDDKYFIQTANIDASTTSAWYGGKGWMPIGYSTDGGFSTYYEFHGNYDGQNHTVSNLYINRTVISCYGLFGLVSNAVIKNLGVTNISITAAGTNDSYGGGLAGYVYVGTTIDNCYSTGTVTIRWYAGGLIGTSGEDGNIPNVIKNSYSSCNVTSTFWVAGGLFSESRNDTIINCYSTGTVTGQNACSYLGGLIGNNSSTVMNCYSSSSVAAGTGESIGGLIGSNYGEISNSYATGSVTTTGTKVGGLIGYHSISYSGTVTNCYSKGTVSGSAQTGGLIGNNSGGTPETVVTNSFWDIQTSGQAASPGGGTGKTTAQMLNQSTYTSAGWDFINETANGNNNYWRIDDNYNNGYPVFALNIADSPDILVTGNGAGIPDESDVPSVSNHTDFGMANISGGTVIRTFTIENYGTSALSLTSVNITGANPADFSVTSAPAVSVAAGASTTFQVTFDPSGTGTRAAVLSIGNNDANENPYNFAVQGTGTALPAVTTQAAASIGTTTATANGNLTSLGYPNPTAYGIVWGTSSNPTTSDGVIDKGAAAAAGAFTASLSGLTENTTYHLRAFATNSAGTVYGDDVTFTTLAAPVLAAIEGAALAYTENDPAAVITGTITVSDADDINIESGVINISANYQSGQDELSFTDQNGITGSWNAGTGVLTLTGTSSLANYQAALRNVTYNNTSQAPSTSIRTVSFTVNDGSLNSNTLTRNINVSSVNDAPVNTVPSADTTEVNANLVFSAANSNQISITDADAGAGSVEVALSVTNGTLSLGGIAGLSFTTGSGTNDAAMIFTGTVTNINSAISSVTYIPATDYQGNSTLSITTNDQGNSGTGGALSDADNIIITVRPPVPVITNVSAAAADGVYKPEDVIPVTVTFNTPVTVNGGTPSIILETGLTDRAALYTSGTGNTLTFNYTVQANDVSADLDYQSTSALILNGATIRNSENTDANLTLPALGGASSIAGQKAIVIDGTAPYVSSVSVPANAIYVSGQDLDFTVNFNEAVILSNNTSYLPIIIGQSVQNAAYFSGNNTTAIVYRYTVMNNDLDSNGVSPGAAINPGTGTIKDAAGNNAILTLNNIADTTGVLVDAVNPSVSSVTVPANGTYAKDALLNFTVNFTEPVSVTGTPGIAVTIGGTSRSANYVSGTGTAALVYRYTVQEGEADTDGITLGASISLNGGTIKDAALNNAALTLSGTGSTTGILVDGVLPTIQSVSVPANGTYKSHQNLDFIVNTDESIVVDTTGGKPRIAVVIGTSTRYANYYSGSGSSALIFRYTVQPGEVDADGITVGALNFNGGAIRDPAGNLLNLTLNSVGSTAAVLVDATNEAPVLAGMEVSALDYIEGNGEVNITTGVIVIDSNDTNIESALIQVTGNYRAGEDILNFINQNGITGSWNTLTGTLTLTGTSSLANYQTALRSVRYNNTSLIPDISDRTISFKVNDGEDESNTVSRIINVQSVNNIPALGIGTGVLRYTEGSEAKIIAGTINVNDADDTNLSGAVIEISGNYRQGEDILSFENQNGITGVWNAAAGKMSLSGSSTVANYQAALRSIKYYNSSVNPDTAYRTVSFTVTDGSSNSNTVTGTIVIFAVNNAPVLSNIETSPISYTDGETGKIITETITADDDDNSLLLSAEVRVSSNYQKGQDLLSFTSQHGITGSWDAETGRLSLNGSAAAVDYQLALRSIAYSNTSTNPDTLPRTISFTINDGITNSNIVSRIINISAVNYAPELSQIETTPLNYTEGEEAKVITNTIFADDKDYANLVSARAAITGNYRRGEDLLSFTNPGGITGIWDEETGIMSLGGSATLANYQAALRSIKYSNLSVNPDTAQRTISFTVNDGIVNSNTAARMVNISVVNRAPVLSNIETTALSYTEKEPAVQVTNTITISDEEDTILVSASVNISANYESGRDVLSFTGHDGIAGSWNASTGTMSLTGSAPLADYREALRSVKYYNTSVTPSTSNRVISFTVNDGINTSSEVSRTISITAVEGAPVLSGIETTQLDYYEGSDTTYLTKTLSISDINSIYLYSAFVQVTGGYYPPEDSLALTGGSSITASWSAAEGKLSLSGKASVEEYQSVLRMLKYINKSGNPSKDIRTISITVTDEEEQSNAAVREIRVLVTNNLPILVKNTGVLVNEGESVVISDSNLYAQDADNSASEISYAITVLPSHGRLTANGTVLKLNDTFTQAAVDNDNLVYAHDSSETISDIFKFRLKDLSETTDEFGFAVTVTPVNDRPVFIDLPDTVKYNEGEETELSLSGKIQDPETPVSELTVELSANADWLKHSYNKETQIIQLSSEKGYSGECELTIKVKDTDGGESSASVKVIVSLISGIKILDEIPTVYSLSQNYPNPFNPSTKIRYSIPEAGGVSLKVYTALGEEVSELVSGYYNTGTYEIYFDAGELSSGLYIIRLTAGSYTQLRKMMLLK